MSFPKIHMQWDGESFHPCSKFWSSIADKNLVVGEEYWVAESKERSGKSHRHYFAAIAEGWSQLPEHYANQFSGPDGPELLRKYCLIEAGFVFETRVVFSNAEDARQAAFLIESRLDTRNYTLVQVKDCVVTRWIAQSQSEKEMGADQFQESKQAVLEVIANMVGISVEELNSNTAKAA